MESWDLRNMDPVIEDQAQERTRPGTESTLIAALSEACGAKMELNPGAYAPGMVKARSGSGEGPRVECPVYAVPS